jgi:hypothetical protein
MKKTSFFMIAFFVIATAGPRTALGQFPGKIKIPKVNQPKPQPSPVDSTQPSPTSNTQPTQPQPESGTTRPSAGGGAEVFATPPKPTETPLLLAETLEIRTDTQDYYWKAPKESNYTSWQPHIRFNVVYGGASRLRYKADYSMPDGSPWYSETLEQKGTDTPYIIESPFESDKDKGKALVTPGTFGVKITNMRDNSVAFQGKFKVIKYKPENTDERYRNLVDFYVDQDFNLPIGHTNVDYSSRTDGLPYVRMWFKGGINSSDLEARLFYNGQQIATTDEGGNVSHVEGRYPKHAGNNPALKWDLYEFSWRSKILFIVTPEARNMTSNRGKLYINQSPGDYTVKVFYKGEQVRETKFTIAEGNFTDNGLAKQNKITTDKSILAVKVMGSADKWNAMAAKTEGFYGNPLSGFGP